MLFDIITYTLLAFGAFVAIWSWGIELHPMLHYMKHKECQLDTVCRHGLRL